MSRPTACRAAGSILVLVLAFVTSGCIAWSGGPRGEFVGQSLWIDNDLGIPVQITYELNGPEAPEIAVNRGTAETEADRGVRVSVRHL